MVLLFALFITSVKIIMPLVGQELMPPMDTGAVNIRLSLDSNLPLERSREVMERVNTGYNLMRRKILRGT